MDPESPLASSLLMRAMLFILTSRCDMDKLTCHGVPILECVLLDRQSLPLYLAGPNLRDGQFGIGKLKTAIAMRSSAKIRGASLQPRTQMYHVLGAVEEVFVVTPHRMNITTSIIMPGLLRPS